VQLEQRVRLAYGSLVEQLQVVDRLRGGSSGQSVDASALRAALVGTAQAAAAARAAVLGLSGSDRPAIHDPLLVYAGAADLYGLQASIAGAALDATDANLGRQLDLLARRVRLLADRVYDRGRTALVGAETSSDGVEVDLVDEVPDFAFEGLAAGPPLTPTAPVSPGSTGRFEPRATSSDATWRATVARLPIPAADEVTRSLDAPEATTLAALVERYVVAEQALRAAPDPIGGRERNDLLRLALLGGADGFRATEAALLAPAGSPVSAVMRASGRQLATVSGELAQLALSASYS
jgi:hypothetical protein